MGKLNDLLHQELRLSIVSFLAGVDKANFNKLLEVTEATKGNLSVQIKKLQQAGYLTVKKSFKDNYPLTECAITKEGRQAFEDYLSDLKKLLNL